MDIAVGSVAHAVCVIVVIATNYWTKLQKSHGIEKNRVDKYLLCTGVPVMNILEELLQALLFPCAQVCLVFIVTRNIEQMRKLALIYTPIERLVSKENLGREVASATISSFSVELSVFTIWETCFGWREPKQAHARPIQNNNHNKSSN